MRIMVKKKADVYLKTSRYDKIRDAILALADDEIYEIDFSDEESPDKGVKSFNTWFRQTSGLMDKGYKAYIRGYIVYVEKVKS